MIYSNRSECDVWPLEMILSFAQRRLWQHDAPCVLESRRHDDKLLFSSTMSLWVVIKVCQMCHRELPLRRSSSLSTRMDAHNYWNIPIVERDPHKDLRLKGDFRWEKLGEWNRAEIRFSVVCARWRMKISDELWIKLVIAFRESCLLSTARRTVDCSSPFFSSCSFKPRRSLYKFVIQFERRKHKFYR